MSGMMLASGHRLTQPILNNVGLVVKFNFKVIKASRFLSGLQANKRFPTDVPYFWSLLVILISPMFDKVQLQLLSRVVVLYPNEGIKSELYK